MLPHGSFHMFDVINNSILPHLLTENKLLYLTEIWPSRIRTQPKIIQILSSQFIIFDPLEEPEREHDSSFISFFKHLVGSKGLDALANPLKEEGLKQMEKKTDDFLIHFLQEMFASA